MKKLLKSSFLSLHSYPKDDISAYIRAGLEFFKDVGFDVANISTSKLLPPDGNWQPIVEQALQDAKELNVPFIDCHLPFYSDKVNTDPEFAELCSKKVHTGIEIAKALGVKHAVLHPNTSAVTAREFDRNAAYDMVMAHMAPFAEHAAKIGVNLAVENMRLDPAIRQSHRYCQDPDEICQVADALGAGVCWDFGHANMVGLKQSEALAYVGKRLKCLHIQDNSGVVEDYTPPFLGSIDWKDAMHGLALAGFEGPLNYEVVTARIPAEIRKTFAKYLVDVADKLMEYIE